jgi:hypothetical protein
MPNIYDLFNSKEIGVYYTNNPSLAIPYMGATLFPSKKQLGLDLSWIKGSNGLPAILKPSAFDTKATLRDRVGFDKIETEMPFFKEAMRIGEKERQELNKLYASSNFDLVMPLITKIYDDVTTLVTGAEVAAERMRMQLLSTGRISIIANRVNYDYDYKFLAGHKETLLTTAKWSALTTATPIQDIQRWQDKVEGDTGSRPTRAVCTRKTWNYLLMNNSIKLDLNPTGGLNVIMTDAMLKQYIQAKLGLMVAVYNKMFKNYDGAATLFFPDDVFTLLPDGNLGSTYFGTTPEESDLMAGANADVTIVNLGVAITTFKEVDPVNVNTKVSAITLPSFESIDTTFIATVNS